MRIIIADGRGERAESVQGVTIQTSGGIPPAWSFLAGHLPATGKVLDYGSWQGLLSLLLKAKGPERGVVFAHRSAAALAQVKTNAAASALPLQCQAVFPLAGSWDAIVLAAPEQNDALDMYAAQAAACLLPGGQVLVADQRSRREILEQHFARVRELGSGPDWAIIQCQDSLGSDPELPWRRLFLSVQGIDLELCSLPGNFSPEGLDAGTRVMLEEARIPQGGRVLDLACGYGVVGIAAARLGAGEVAFVDEDLAAITATRNNLKNLGLQGELVRSHLPGAAAGNFDCIMTNPPYHTDYGVAKSFLEYAARRLNQGGWLYVVVKKPEWYYNKLRSIFGGCRGIEREGYTVLAAQQRPRGAVKPASANTTRKHMKKLAAKGRGRHSG